MPTDYSRRTAHLGVFAALLTAVMAGFHITVITVDAGVVDVASLLMLILAALVVAGGLLFFRRAGAQRSPFGLFVLHTVSFVIVVGSISAHALVAGWAGGFNDGLFWMVVCWGAGLLIHAFASVRAGGFADVVA